MTGWNPHVLSGTGGDSVYLCLESWVRGDSHNCNNHDARPAARSNSDVRVGVSTPCAILPFLPTHCPLLLNYTRYYSNRTFIFTIIPCHVVRRALVTLFSATPYYPFSFQLSLQCPFPPDLTNINKASFISSLFSLFFMRFSLCCPNLSSLTLFLVF